MMEQCVDCVDVWIEWSNVWICSILNKCCVVLKISHSGPAIFSL